jgi:short-subunit dehydrogenase involved in D-alanine esterification of teichoic acids
MLAYETCGQLGTQFLITGGGSGIGGGLARAFRGLGNHVIVAGRRREVLEKTGLDFVVLDTRDRASIGSAAVEVAARFPELNVVINNAGVERSEDFSATDEAAIVDEIQTNIVGVKDLASDAEELPVAGARFLYSVGVGEKFAAVFGQMNS